MKPASGQFNLPSDTVDSERISADFAASMEQVNRADVARRPIVEVANSPESQADKIARDTQEVFNVFAGQSEVQAKPEISEIEHRMVHLGDLAKVLDRYRNDEINR